MTEESDSPENPKMAFAWAVRTGLSSGRIRRIHAARAFGVEGILGVLTHENALRCFASAPAAEAIHLPLQDDQIRFRGQCVAVVIGETLEAACHGAALIGIDYESEAESCAEGRTVVTSSRAETAADLTVEFAGTVANWSSAGLVVQDTSPAAAELRGSVAAVTGWPEKKVRVLPPSLGQPAALPLEDPAPALHRSVVAALASRHVERPVQLVMPNDSEAAPVIEQVA